MTMLKLSCHSSAGTHHALAIEQNLSPLCRFKLHMPVARPTPSGQKDEQEIRSWAPFSGESALDHPTNTFPAVWQEVPTDRTLEPQPGPAHPQSRARAQFNKVLRSSFGAPSMRVRLALLAVAALCYFCVVAVPDVKARTDLRSELSRCLF